MMSGLASSSLMTPLIRSSKSPRYFVPATTAVRSSARMRFVKSTGEHVRRAICCASPSTTALLPTPGSPMRMGLFFFRRQSISAMRAISSSRPTTGSRLSAAAAAVRSVEKLSSTGVPDLPVGSRVEDLRWRTVSPRSRDASLNISLNGLGMPCGLSPPPSSLSSSSKDELSLHTSAKSSSAEGVAVALATVFSVAVS